MSLYVPTYRSTNLTTLYCVTVKQWCSLSHLLSIVDRQSFSFGKEGEGDRERGGERVGGEKDGEREREGEIKGGKR